MKNNEQQMKKKEYFAPEMEILEINHEGALLGDSPCELGDEGCVTVNFN